MCSFQLLTNPVKSCCLHSLCSHLFGGVLFMCFCRFNFHLNSGRLTSMFIKNACFFIILFIYFVCLFVSHRGLMKWWKLRQAKKEYEVDLPQWEADYKLNPLPDHHLFWEYLEVGKWGCFVVGLFLCSFVQQPTCTELPCFEDVSDVWESLTH